MYSKSQVWAVVKDFPVLDMIQVINRMRREGKISFEVQESLLKNEVKEVLLSQPFDPYEVLLSSADRR